jgi:hypothetical protein
MNPIGHAGPFAAVDFPQVSLDAIADYRLAYLARYGHAELPLLFPVAFHMADKIPAHPFRTLIVHAEVRAPPGEALGFRKCL